MGKPQFRFRKFFACDLLTPQGVSGRNFVRGGICTLSMVLTDAQSFWMSQSLFYPRAEGWISKTALQCFCDALVLYIRHSRDLFADESSFVYLNETTPSRENHFISAENKSSDKITAGQNSKNGNPIITTSLKDQELFKMCQLESKIHQTNTKWKSRLNWLQTKINLTHLVFIK